MVKGHRETRVWVGFELLGVKLVSAGEWEWKEIGPENAATGDRLSGASGQAPIELLGLGGGVRLLRAGESQEAKEAEPPKPPDPPPVPYPCDRDHE